MKGGFFLGMCFRQAQKDVEADGVIVRKQSGVVVPLTVAKDIELGHFGVDLLCNSGSENFSFANGLGDVEHKGGQEGEDLIDGKVTLEILVRESNHSLPDVVCGLAVNENYALHAEAVDSDSPRYYQYSLSGASGSNIERENSFTDLELASGHVSDPGTYRAKELESICTSPTLSHGVEAEEKKKAGKESQKQVSVSALGELDSRPDHHNAVSGHPQIVRLSCESSSAGCEGREVSNISCVPAGGSPRSEGADQFNNNHAMFKLSATGLALESQKRKPWWKVFLASNTNAHMEVNGGIFGAFSEGDVERMSQGNGYISDADSRGGRVSPSILPGGASDTEREQNNSRRLVDLTSQVSRYGKEKVTDDLGPPELLESEANGDISASLSHEDDFSRGIFRAFGTAQKWDSSYAKNGSSRVDEWVSSTLHTIGSSIDDEQTHREGEIALDSPTFPAASFFESEDRQQVASGVIRVGGTAENDVETTRIVARLVNPLSAAADFSGVGLKVMPSLGIFGSLKTLNLSANNFIRIIPGSLPKSLQSLDISRNNILVIEGLRELTRLRVLNLSFNRISRTGNGLSSCTSLKEVYLAGNKISEVEGLHRLSKLVVLDVSFNKLITTKSMGQIAANNNSLKALNLLGNAVHSNLGDEQTRRFVTGICPKLIFLNKQALKPISHREALGKDLKGSVKHSAKPTKRGSAHRPASSHRRTKSGEVAGNVKSKSGGKEVVSTAAALVAHGEAHLRKGYHQIRPTSSKEMLPKGFIPLPVAANLAYLAQGARVLGPRDSAGLLRAKSDGIMLRDDDNWSPAIPRGIVQAH